MNEIVNSEINSPGNNNESRHRLRKKRRKRKSKFTKFVESLKNNPLKIIAPFFIIIIVYLSGLFFLYDDGEMSLREQRQLTSPHDNDVIKGIVIPFRILERRKALIDFGNKENVSLTDEPATSVSLKQLSEGYTIYPMSLVSCGDASDSSKFTLFMDGNRLYININFNLLYSDAVEATIQKGQWTRTPKNISGFYSDDSLLEVLDDKGNVLFNMKFTDNDMLSITGYFIGKKCVCIAGGGDGGVTSQPNDSDNMEKTLEEIQSIKKIHIYN